MVKDFFEVIEIENGGLGKVVLKVGSFEVIMVDGSFEMKVIFINEVNSVD